MDENIKKAFLKVKYETNDNLAQDIWLKIASHNKRIIRLKLYTFSLLSLVSLVGFFPVFKILLNDFAKSGFYEYLSIAFSLNGAFISYWKELSYSLAESLPITSIIFSFALIFVFFISIKYALKQIIKGQLYYQY